MAVTAKWYTNGPKSLATGVNWTSDTIKVAACSATYTPDQDAHDFFNDITGELTTANGYTAGGATLGTKSVNADTTTNVTSLRAAPTTWTPGAGQTLTIRYLVVYKSTGTASTSPLLGYVDLGADVSATNADWTATWDATDGVLKITAS